MSGRMHFQKQPSRGVLNKSCSENMHQAFRRTSMPKCDFDKVAMQLYWNYTLAWVFSCKFAAYFQNTSFLERLWVGASTFWVFTEIHWQKFLDSDFEIETDLSLLKKASTGRMFFVVNDTTSLPLYLPYYNSQINEVASNI